MDQSADGKRLSKKGKLFLSARRKKKGPLPRRGKENVTPSSIPPPDENRREGNAAAMNTDFSRNITPSTSSRTSPLQVELEENVDCEVTDLTGRRLVNVKYLFQQIAAINHSPFSCTFKDLLFVNEIRAGFQSQFVFTCKMCGVKEVFDSENVEMNINHNVVQGVVCSGSSFSQLDEFCGHLNMPCMAEKTFIKENFKLGDELKDAAIKSMHEAGIEERKIALEKGHVGADGIPYITVVADASWGKRSYRTSNYNSLSGVACIIGHETKKVLFLGVRNSYCSVCAVAKNKDVEPKEHRCFKNWAGTSTAMEADGVVEGFKCSINMHGLKFTNIIGDGDSSVMNALNEAQPYGHQTQIKKIECSNHLLRNYCTKLRNLTKKVENRQGKVPIVLRKCLNSNILRLRKAIKGAVDHTSKLSDKTLTEKVNILKEDLRNGPCHVFGAHQNCKAYFCSGSKPGEEDFVSRLKDCGLWHDIYASLTPIINNSDSLLNAQTNNIVEQFNSLIAKFVGGKRINYSLRGSYESRCYAAATKRNTGGLIKTLQQASGNVDDIGKFGIQYEKRHLARLKRKSTQERRGKRAKRIGGPDEHYGEIEKEEDIESDEYENRKKKHFEEIKKTADEIKSIERNTVGQATNPEWVRERKLRLTASTFGQVCKMRPSTSCKNIVKTLLYSNFKGNDATKYGVQNEPIAVKEVENLLGVEIKPCGLFIDEQCHYLGASPDGLIGDDAIVEIKCPSGAATMSPTEGILQKKITFCLLDVQNPDNITLKKNHNYYYQVQGQLNITKRKYCFFVVWTPKGIKYEKIKKDVTFWENDMKIKLENFYINCLLPEIIDPRIPRKLPIRERCE